MRRQLPTSEPQELGPERAEPRLFPVNPAPPPSPPATANPGILSATRDDEPKPSNSAAILAPGRRPAAAVGRRARSLLYVALAGFAFVAVAGYLLFTAPPRTTVPASDSSASEPSQAVRIPEPIPHEAKTSLPAAPAVTSGGPDEKPAAAADATPKSAGEADQPSPPVSAEVSSGQPANPQSSLAGPAGVAAGPPFSAKNIVEDHHATRPPNGNHRPDHARSAARHPHPRSAREPRRSELEPRPVQHSMAQQAEQAASFDRLVNQLTQPTPPAGQSLTPPAPGTTDPFAQRASDR
jgi:hypothetical protein